MGGHLLELVCSGVKDGGRLVALHGGVQGGLQLVPAHVGEVQVLVRLDVELLPEQVGKVQDPLVDLKGLVLLRAGGCLRLLQQAQSTCQIPGTPVANPLQGMEFALVNKW